jgi:hypothetical protein
LQLFHLLDTSFLVLARDQRESEAPSVFILIS